MHLLARYPNEETTPPMPSQNDKSVHEQTDEIFGDLLLEKLKFIKSTGDYTMLDGALINAVQRRLSAVTKGERPANKGDRELMDTFGQITRPAERKPFPPLVMDEDPSP